MKPLRQLLDKLHPMFTKGGKLERFFPLYEAGDTFLFTPGEVTDGASHVRDSLDLKRMMITVVAALGPCILMAMWNTGYQANLNLEEIPGWRGSIMAMFGLTPDATCPLSNLLHGALYFVPLFLVTNIAGGICEVIFSCIRNHEINEGFLVTGMLFPLTLPATMPWWQAAVGIAFGVVIAKEVFGGTGKNFLNVALTGRAFLYFAYPGQITGDSIWTPVDGLTGATPLGALGSLASEKASLGMEVVTGASGLGVDWFTAFIGIIPGSMGETSALACLIGAAILIATGIGSWKIMAGVVLGRPRNFFCSVYDWQRNERCFCDASVLASGGWWLCLRHRFHGDRSRNGILYQRRKMAVRNADWVYDNPHSRGQPGVSGRNYVGDFVRQHFRTVDRLFLCSS